MNVPQNCDAVSLSTWVACPATFVNVLLVAFSISNHFTSIHPLYERYEPANQGEDIRPCALCGATPIKKLGFLDTIHEIEVTGSLLGVEVRLKICRKPNENFYYDCQVCDNEYRDHAASMYITIWDPPSKRISPCHDIIFIVITVIQYLTHWLEPLFSWLLES